MRIQLEDAALEKLMQRAEKYVLPGKIQVSMLEVQLRYLTRRENFKCKKCYCLVPKNLRYGDEYLDFFAEDMRDCFKRKNPWVSGIEIYDIACVGNIYYDESSIKKSISHSNIIDIAAGDDANGNLLDVIKKTHYKNLLYKDFSLPVQRIDFAYDTVRGNRKSDFRLLFTDFFERAKETLMGKILELNRKAPYKALLNVQILDSVCSGVIRAV